MPLSPFCLRHKLDYRLMGWWQPCSVLSAWCMGEKTPGWCLFGARGSRDCWLMQSIWRSADILSLIFSPLFCLPSVDLVHHMCADWHHTFLYRLEAGCVQCLCDHCARRLIAPVCFSITCLAAGMLLQRRKLSGMLQQTLRMHSRHAMQGYPVGSRMKLSDL